MKQGGIGFIIYTCAVHIFAGRSVVMRRGGDEEYESQCVVIRHVSSGVFDTLPLVQVFD